MVSKAVPGLGACNSPNPRLESYAGCYSGLQIGNVMLCVGCLSAARAKRLMHV